MVTAARLARDIMRLTLLLGRRYAPYTKWLGTAFAELPAGDDLSAHLTAAVQATHITGREAALADAYRAVARRHNSAGLTAPVDATIRTYHDRPARVLMADRFTDACLATVTDPFLRALPLLGAVDAVVDSTDVLSTPSRYRRLADLYANAGGAVPPHDPGPRSSTDVEPAQMGYVAHISPLPREDAP